MIKCLETFLDTAGEETKRHSLDTENIAKIISKEAIKAGMITEKEKKIFFECARYHDIGKSLIPDSILYKPEKLSDKDFIIIKKHPIFGKEILESFQDKIPSGIYPYLYESVTQHHLRIDKTGYPFIFQRKGLSDMVQLVSICDTLSAMTMNRCYHKGINIRDAIINLENENPRKFSDKIFEILDKSFEIEKEKQIKFTENDLTFAER